MNHSHPTQCCVFAAWTVVSETLLEQVWALICPDHGQAGPEVMLAHPCAAVAPLGSPAPHAGIGISGRRYRASQAA